MEDSKYIIIEYMEHEVAIVFCNLIEHKAMAGQNKVISAGQFQVFADPTEHNHDHIEVVVFGKSTTLDKESREKKDAEIIALMLNTHNNY